MSRVRVYFNSTEKNFTVQTNASGKWRKSFSTEDITLCGVKFLCSHKSRLRVIATKQKFVHAYFEGAILDDQLKGAKELFRLEPENIAKDPLITQITYNPCLFPNSYPEEGAGTQRYGELSDRSIINCFWDITNQKARRCCGMLRLKVMNKKPKLIAWAAK